MKKEIDLSIIIVSMNKIDLLLNCIESIVNSTIKLHYEIIVVAYMFESDNLKQLKNKFSQIKVIENNEIAGFSENNNLGIKFSKGRYCLIINDDTYIKKPLIDELVFSFKAIENEDDKIAILSPVLYFPNGNIQYNGREKSTYKDYILSKLNINFIKRKKVYSNKSNIYQTYNITGACFMIKSSIFKELGYFDEKYFFCPEDIALSTLANERGYRVYVDTNLSIYHIHRSSSKSLLDIITPVEEIGSCLFYGKSNKKILITLKLIVFIQAFLKIIFWIFNFINKNKNIYINAYKNTLLYIFSSYTPKELFLKLYKNTN
ncbi:MAG: glycosyltransferase [Paludibacter sp.]|nr:glycosyltransferase [Paludibacter sp.]